MSSSSNNNNRKQAEYKIAVVGGGGVGKSSLTIQFVQHYYQAQYDPTIEDSYQKQIKVDDKVVQLEITDTAGQDEFIALRDTYMRRNDGFVLVFDVTMKQSLEELINFIEGIKRVKEDSNSIYSSIPFVIVANKCDLAEQRIITKKQAQQFIVESLELPSDTPYFETSAKFRTNCDEPFDAMVRRMWKFKINNSNNNGNNTKKEDKSSSGGLFSSVSNNNDKDKDLQAFNNM